ncbi:hypothetical protein ID866_8875 [Astraeus odoratus]|nr:hypothetical protein ID866_8875 [Astraeus odoratus]
MIPFGWMTGKSLLSSFNPYLALIIWLPMPRTSLTSFR